MTIIINGEVHELSGPVSLEQLLQELEIVPQRVAVMVNDRIVPRSGRHEVQVQAHDRIEIVTFMGGG